MNVMVVTRPSIVPGLKYSSAVECRLLEPMDYLEQEGKLRCQTVSAKDSTEINLKEFDCILFQKHGLDEDLRLAQRAKELHVPVLYDIDDWMFDFPLYTRAKVSPQYLENPLCQNSCRTGT